MSTVKDLAGIPISECEREPIHIPGAIQSFGILLVLQEPELSVIQFSENAPSQFGLTRESMFGKTIGAFFEEPSGAAFQKALLESGLDAPNRLSTTLSPRDCGAQWMAEAYRWDGVLLVELSRTDAEAPLAANLYSAVRKTMADLDACQTLPSFCQAAAENFRNVTGFARVMIYRFLDDQSGVVIAESLSEGVDSFLGLRYPASDIPAQARRLYTMSSYRLTADVNALPVSLVPPFNPRTGKPLDLSYCALRATSPFHLEYLQNMGVTASASFSIVLDGKLWGLVACHNRTPKVLSAEARAAAEILTRLLGLQVGFKEEAERKNYAGVLQRTRAELSARLQDCGDFAAALLAGSPNLLTAIQAGGVALCTGSKTFCLGETPGIAEIEQLRAWLRSRPWEPVWSTDSLPAVSGLGKDIAASASGVLAIQMAPGSPEAVLWFRPELVQVVRWAGNPNDSVSGSASLSPLGPKRSFELWQEQVRSRSAPWNAVELLHATNVRDDMSQALLRHWALEIGRLNAELLRSNRELERFSAVASHDLQEPLRTITTYTELLFRRGHLSDAPESRRMVEFVKTAADRMSKLISSLLNYATAGTESVQQRSFEMGEAVQIALANLSSRISETSARIHVGIMPCVSADREEVVQLLQNLLSNALKYRHPNVAPEISIQAKEQGTAWLFSITDNGVGFDPAFGEAIFEPFRRLHGHEVTGSGLGLAICRRIVEGSGGKIWAQGEVGQGATVHFTLQSAQQTPVVNAGAKHART